MSSRKAITKVQYIVLIVIIIAAAGASFYAGRITAPTSTVKLDKVTFGLDYYPYMIHFPFYAADELGYFAEQGISITIFPGVGSMDTVTRVDTGVLDFGFAGIGSVVLGRLRNDFKVKEVVMIQNKHPIAMMWLTARTEDLTTAKDLEGKSIGIPLGTEMDSLWPSIVEFFDLDESTITIEHPAYAALQAGCAQGLYELICTYVSGVERLEETAVEFGLADPTAKASYLADWGFDLYANGIVARDKMIEENPNLVKRFITAISKALIWCLDNPEDAYDIYMKYNPEALPDRPLSNWHNYAVDYILFGTEENGIGYMEEDKVKFTAETIAASEGITQQIVPGDFYTNEFIEQVPDDYRFYTP